MKTPRSNARFSLISSGTEESLASSCVATPLDLSPRVLPSSGMITIVASDSYPGRTQLPMVVSQRQPRHRQEHSPHPNRTLMPYQQQLATSQHHGPSLGQSNSRFWPRVKRMVIALGSSLREAPDSHDSVVSNNPTDHVMQHQLVALQDSPDHSRTRRFFFPNNKHRVQPSPKG